MSPEQYAAVGTEHAHQVALFMWMQQNRDIYPELEWAFAIPNGGERNPAVAARLKAEGVKSGVSDIFIPVPRGYLHGLFIEMKKPGGKESQNQKEFGAFVSDLYYWYECCDHWEKARDLIVRYMTGNLI
jgi:hypothetical protein